jgi:hypothetical protein
MSWIKHVLSALVLISATSLVKAQSESKTVYIYQDGNVLVHDSITLTLDRGIQEIELYHLPEYVDFETLMVRLNGSVHHLRWTMPLAEDWATRLKSFVGQNITLEHTSGKNISGTLIHTNSGVTVIRLTDNSQTLIHDLDGYTINVSNWDLSTSKRRVIARLEPIRAGRQVVSTSYLMQGLNWNNTYAMILSKDDKSVTWSGFTQLRNTSNHSFEQIGIRLVAGTLNRRQNLETTGYDVQLRASSSMNIASEYSPEMRGAAFGDLQLFTLAGKQSVQPGEQVRIPLFFADGIEVQKRYRYRSMDRNHEFPQSGLIQIHYDIQNTSKNKLGQAIPNGSVALYRMNDGQPVLIGEDTIGNIATDGVISVSSGSAFDMLLKETITNQNRISDRIMEYTVEIMVQNRKSERVVVELERYLNPNQTIVRSGQPFVHRSARHQVTELHVPSGADVTMEFTIRNER